MNHRITWPYWADGGKQTLDGESKDSKTGKIVKSLIADFDIEKDYYDV